MEQKTYVGMNVDHYHRKVPKMLDVLKKNKELIGVFLTFFFTILGVLYGMVRYFYSLEAEQFYGIPKFYFYDSLQTDYVMKGIFILAIIMTFFSPPLIKKFLKKNKLRFFESLCYSFFLAFVVFYVALIFCVSFVTGTLQMKVDDRILFPICIFLGLASWATYFLIFYTDLTEDQTIDERKTDKKKEQKEKIIELKTKADKIALAFAIVTGISAFMFTLLIIYSAPFRPENKKNYEIVQGENSEYKIIIGYYKDSAVLMKGKINRQNSKSISLNITKGNYKLVPIKNKNLVYCHFNLVICERNADDMKRLYDALIE